MRRYFLFFLLLMTALPLIACDDKKDGDDGDKKKAAAVSDADLQAACDNMKALIENEKRAARTHGECLSKTRGLVSADKLAGYVGCLKGAKSEDDLVSCQKAAH